MTIYLFHYVTLYNCKLWLFENYHRLINQIKSNQIILQHYKHYKKVCEKIDLGYKKNYKITRITTFMTKMSSTNICLQSSLEKLQYYLQPPCNYKILGG